eukprot:evm.model.NODE_26015_length_37756_cov_44.158253.3
MDCFFPLIEHFHTQSDPAYCGLGSLAMLLNALAIDPGRTWKGSWRWFDESLLDCCEPLEVVQSQGISLVKANCLARCNGAKSRLRHGDTVSLEGFRDDVRRVTSSVGFGGGGKANGGQEPPSRKENEFMLCGYSRKLLGQTGDGHFSPIGGYHAAKDLVLILDVARFKYPPHWVPLPLLHAALQPHDSATGKARGYLLLSQNRWSEALLFTLDPDRFVEWPALRDWLLELHQQEAQAAIKGMEGRGEGGGRRILVSNETGFKTFVSAVPEFVASLVTTYAYLKCILHDYPGRNSSSSSSSSSGNVRKEHPQEAFLRPLVRAIEAYPAFALLPPPGRDTVARVREGKESDKEKRVCCPPISVDERHALVVFFLALVAWAGEELEEGEASSSFPSSSWKVEDEALKREVTQLKVRLQAIATELSSSLIWDQH